VEDDSDKKDITLSSSKKYKNSIKSKEKYRIKLIIKSFIWLTYGHFLKDVNKNNHVESV